MKNILYIASVLTQNSVLIWRLYVVCDRNPWALLPLIFELARTAFASASIFVTPSDSTLSEINIFAYISWSLDIVINVGVTTAIAARLWYMASRTGLDEQTPGGVPNVYVKTVTMVVESGAVSAATSLVLLILLATSNPAALPAVTPGTQLAVLVPLMIIVRVGLGLTHGLPSAYKAYLTRIGGRQRRSPPGLFKVPFRCKAARFGGRQIAVHQDVVTTDNTGSVSSTIEITDFKAMNNRNDSDEGRWAPLDSTQSIGVSGGREHSESLTSHFTHSSKL